MRDDLFDALRTLPAADPMPAAEVRRRGDRLRRRRTTVQVVGVAAIVAVIAAGSVLTGDRLAGREGPPIIETPQPGPTTEPPREQPQQVPGIPADFPIDTGWPEPGGDLVEESLPGTQGVDVCGKTIAMAGVAHWTGRSSVYPEDYHARQLFVFESRADAATAVDRIIDAARACPTHGGDAADGVASTRLEAVPVGDGLGVLRWHEFQGSLAVGAGSTVFYTRDHAVLVTSRGTEGAGRADALALAEAEDALVQPALAAMCTWSPGGCGSPGAIGSLPPEVLLTATELGEQVRPFIDGPWTRVEDRDNPTLDCQEAGLRSLTPARMAFREWTGPGDSRAATAVLAFDDPGLARSAYEVVAGWLDACLGTMEGARQLTPRGKEAFHAPDEEEFAKTWRIYTGPAPEQCTACDSGWIDVQGVALVDTSVVVASVGGIGDLQLVPDRADWMRDLLIGATARVQEGS